MPKKPFRLLFLSIMLFGAGANIASAAAPEDEYVALMTAIEIDRACVALKYMESSQARSAAFGYLEQTSQYRLSLDGRLPMTEYNTWVAALDQKAQEAAKAAGCTPQGMPYVSNAKAKAAEHLYRGLMLAYHFASLPDADTNKIPLDEQKARSATGYEAYLSHLYGENFRAFAEHQRALAEQAVAVPNEQVGSMLFSIEAESVASLWDAQMAARSAVNAVQFEVTAEANGYFVRPHQFGDGWTMPTLHRPELSGFVPVVKGPGYLLIDVDGDLVELYLIAVVLPDRRLGLMFFGETAKTRMQDPTVRLYVRQGPYPPGANEWTAFDHPEFRDGAKVFDARLNPGNCLGAPCYEFPVEATDALLANPAGDHSELFISFQPNAEAPAIAPGTLGRERFKNDLLLRWFNELDAQ